MLMPLKLYRPTPIVEERGGDFFIPAHPEPLQKPPGLAQILLGARYSLIDNWSRESYRSGVDCFRILARQVVVANSPEAVKYVMVTHHANFERKSPQMRRALEALIGDGLFISDGDTWKKRRPLVADLVHKKRLPEFAPTMEGVVQAVAQRWASLPPGQELELTSEMASLTAEIVSQTVFGRNLGKQAAERVIEGFAQYQTSIDNFNLPYWLGADEGWPVFRNFRTRRAIAQVHAVIDGVIEAHLAGGGDQGSMIDLLIKRNQRSPDLALDINALRNEAATIFMAGHETTATTLAWAWYLIANAPWIEQQIHAEIAAVCGDRPVQMSDLRHLEWCRSVILETLRLYPPVPLLPRQAREPDQIGPLQIEKGALVLVAPWLLHRAEDLWDRPNHFRPERFVAGEKMDPFAFIPFSVGPRICAGLNFGQEEAVLCLAGLAQNFRVRPRPGFRINPVCRLTLRSLHGIPATIQKR